MNVSLYVFSVGDPVTITAHVWAFDEEEAAECLAALFARHDGGNDPLPTTSFSDYLSDGDHPCEEIPYVEHLLVWNCGVKKITADDITHVAGETEIEGAA